jgi:hypothetical protein
MTPCPIRHAVGPNPGRAMAAEAAASGVGTPPSGPW